MNSKIISFAIEAHNNTNHLYDGKPYSVHLAMVAMIAQKYIDCIPEQAQSDVLSACWLHDTIEDCRLTYNDVKQVAGETVANIVYAVTNEKGKNRKERANEVYYDGIKKTMWANYVKLCDRLANVQYSYDNNSRMYGVYQKENDAFLQALFPNESEMNQYRDIINDLKKFIQSQEGEKQQGELNHLYPIQFAEWLSENEWIKRKATHPNKVGQYYSHKHCEYKTIEQLFDMFSALEPIG